jgi:hypothetical protein
MASGTADVEDRLGHLHVSTPRPTPTTAGTQNELTPFGLDPVAWQQRTLEAVDRVRDEQVRRGGVGAIMTIDTLVYAGKTTCLELLCLHLLRTAVAGTRGKLALVTISSGARSRVKLARRLRALVQYDPVLGRELVQSNDDGLCLSDGTTVRHLAVDPNATSSAFRGVEANVILWDDFFIARIPFPPPDPDNIAGFIAIVDARQNERNGFTAMMYGVVLPMLTCLRGVLLVGAGTTESMWRAYPHASFRTLRDCTGAKDLFSGSAIDVPGSATTDRECVEGSWELVRKTYYLCSPVPTTTSQ